MEEDLIKADAQKMIELNNSLKELNEFKRYFDEKYKVTYEGACDEGLMALINIKKGSVEYEFTYASLGGENEKTRLFNEYHLALFKQYLTNSQ